MERKRQEEYALQYNTKDAIAPFKDSFSLYLFKKTEKFVLALYLVTDHLSFNEPLKKDIRDVANSLIGHILAVTTSGGETYTVDGLRQSMYHVISLLDLGVVSGMVSENNVALIKEEIMRFVKDIDAYSVATTSRTDLKKTFFEVDVPKSDATFNKGHKGQIEKDMSFIKTAQVPRTAQPASSPSSVGSSEQRKEKKTPVQNKAAQSGQIKERQEKIVALIKDKGTVMITDVADHFTDVSDKTIQRELQKLVAQGVLIKEGERRWSTYRLADK